MERKRGGLLCVPHNPSLSLPHINLPLRARLVPGVPDKKGGAGRRKQKKKEAKEGEQKRRGYTRGRRREIHPLLASVSPLFFFGLLSFILCPSPASELATQEQSYFCSQSGTSARASGRGGQPPLSERARRSPIPKHDSAVLFAGRGKRDTFSFSLPHLHHPLPDSVGGRGGGGVCVGKEKNTRQSTKKTLARAHTVGTGMSSYGVSSGSAGPQPCGIDQKGKEASLGETNHPLTEALARSLSGCPSPFLDRRSFVSKALETGITLQKRSAPVGPPLKWKGEKKQRGSPPNAGGPVQLPRPAALRSYERGEAKPREKSRPRKEASHQLPLLGNLSYFGLPQPKSVCGLTPLPRWGPEQKKLVLTV